MSGRHKVEVVSHEESDGTFVIEEQPVESPASQTSDLEPGSSNNWPISKPLKDETRAPSHGSEGADYLESAHTSTPKPHRSRSSLIMGGVVLAAILCGITVYTNYNGCSGRTSIRPSSTAEQVPSGTSMTPAIVDMTDTGTPADDDNQYNMDNVDAAQAPGQNAQPTPSADQIQMPLNREAADTGLPPEPVVQQPTIPSFNEQAEQSADQSRSDTRTKMLNQIYATPPPSPSNSYRPEDESKPPIPGSPSDDPEHMDEESALDDQTHIKARAAVEPIEPEEPELEEDEEFAAGDELKGGEEEGEGEGPLDDTEETRQEGGSDEEEPGEDDKEEEEVY